MPKRFVWMPGAAMAAIILLFSRSSINTEATDQGFTTLMVDREEVQIY